MQAFKYARATSLRNAVDLLAEHRDNARVLAGGTDLIVAMREGRLSPEVVVDVKSIPELMQLRFDPVEGLEIGAAVPCFRIYSNRAIADAYPGLMDAARLIGGVQIQGRASLGGNLCNASPAADSIPALIAHHAVCTVVGPNGRRKLPVEHFCSGPGETVLQPGEFLVSLQVPAPEAGFGAAYLRFIPRNEMDIAVVGVGVSLQLDEAGERCEHARIALAAVAPTPLFVPEAGKALMGRAVSEATMATATRLAQEGARPISDLRGSAAYRRHLVGVITRRALEQAVLRARHHHAGA